MKQWWMQLQKREQQLVGAMVAFVVLFLAFNFIWQPLNDGLDKAEKKLDRQQELLAYIQESTEKYKAANKGGSANRSGGSLSTVVNRVAKQHQIDIARMQPQGEQIQLWIDEVSFNQLLVLLNDLTLRQGLQVSAIDITKGNSDGSVRVRRLQLSRG